MLDAVPPDDRTRQPICAEFVDGLCEQFIESWRSGQQPTLEATLGDVAASQRDLVFRRLLELEVRLRRTNGEDSRADEYHARFPGYQQLIDDVFRNDRVAGDSTSSPSLAETLILDSRTPAETVTPARRERIGRYLLRSVLGRGGFGDVYLAYDEELDREVAIKLPATERFDSSEAIDRFVKEARTVAKLKHHAIVPVFDAGRTDDGRPFVVMQYVEGKTLRDLLRSGGLSNHHAARLLSEVAEGVAYAHKQGLVHRDLKPGNILLDSEGRPLVADFGLAVDEQEQRRRVGELAGTLQYMAPEQVRGDVHRLDGRSDIWALGVMLYETLTGRLPFGGDSVEQLSDEIQHRDPKPPRQIDENIAPELERIISKCCAKPIAKRYSTAADLAADLRSFSPPATKQTEPGVNVRRLLGAIAISAVCVLVAFGLVPSRVTDRDEMGRRASDQQGGLLPEIDLPSSLEGTIDVRIWGPKSDRRSGLSLYDPAARPLQTNDRVRIETRLNHPAYVYILWVDSEGAVLPLYPWEPGDWESRPSNESPVEHVSLPAVADEAWPLEGAPGMETLLMLVRKSPLPSEFDLQQALSALPRHATESPSEMVESVNGQVITVTGQTDRGPRLADPRKVDDAVLTTQRMIHDLLGEHFQYIRAVSFANAGAARRSSGSPLGE